MIRPIVNPAPRRRTTSDAKMQQRKRQNVKVTMVKRAMDAATKGGMKVNYFRVFNDGSFALSSIPTPDAKPVSIFDEWEDRL